MYICIVYDIILNDTKNEVRKTIYETTASATGGRDGHVASADGVLDFDVRVPKSMGGPGGAYTNPEQLFAAGYAACFDSALNLIAESAEAEDPVCCICDGRAGFQWASRFWPDCRTIRACGGNGCGNSAGTSGKSA